MNQTGWAEPEIPRDNKYLLSIVNCFTEWCVVVLLRSMGLRTVAEAIPNRLAYEWGAPLQLHSDESWFVVHYNSFNPYYGMVYGSENGRCDELQEGSNSPPPMQLKLDALPGGGRPVTLGWR